MLNGCHFERLMTREVKMLMVSYLPFCACWDQLGQVNVIHPPLSAMPVQWQQLFCLHPCGNIDIAALIYQFSTTYRTNIQIKYNIENVIFLRNTNIFMI